MGTVTPKSQAGNAAAPAALPRARPDWTPLALVPLVIVLAYPLVGSGSTWFTLSVAGLAMGMIIFVVASGLTLVFGLMDVLNFGHGAFVALGAYVGASVMLPLAAWSTADSIGLNLGVLGLAALAAMAAGAAIGFVFERLAVRPVYGQHLKQILVTMGGMIVAQEAIKVIWGGQDIALAVPAHLEGSVLLGGAAIEKYRLLAMALGLAVFVAMLLVLSRTRIGLLIRAGVESREMVEALGYRINRVFIGVFVVGAALAGLGGALWGLYQQNVSVTIGAQLNVLIFMVVIIGGLGSTTGCFIGALLIGLMENYTSFLFPQVAMFSDIALMMLILLWRPQGLYPVARR
ncbi:branched-chain amino acid ABC transporter permease [Paraburkholderia acidipaludis]|uniref:branched-chain amino acid ABC transporter permease n=1 Tax=Paraburkholderia acidipaludis TaxID=660537 RepID=UPI000483E972|nr:branched-chain amino acid ABC transporter permease [Paraburkholderia acidipaludis]